MATQTRKLSLNDVGTGVGDGEQNDPFNQPVAFEDIKGDQLLPLGEYEFLNVKVELALSKSSSQPMFNVQAVIQSGEFEGTKKYFSFSWSPGAQPRSKTAFVGMGMPENYRASTLRDMAMFLDGLHYYAIIDTEQSDGINDKTQRPYDPRNKVASTSQSPVTAG